MRLAPFLIIISLVLLLLTACGNRENEKPSEPGTIPVESPDGGPQTTDPRQEPGAVPQSKSQMEKKKDSLIALKPRSA